MDNRTIRERLLAAFRADTVDAIRRTGIGTEWDLLDVPVEDSGFAATRGTGALQFSCSGTAIAWFRPKTTRRELLLCFDDTDGEAWDARSRETAQLRPGVNVQGVIGPRPHPLLRLVQTA